MSVSRLDTLLLTCAVLFTTATQLRLSGIPIGVGETLLIVWIVWRVLVVALNPADIDRIRSVELLIIFWLILLSVLTIALSISYVRGTWDEAGAGHDFIALLLGAVFSVLLAHALVDEERIRMFCRALFRTTAVAVFLLLLLAASRQTFLGIEPWYAAFRFTGWAANPNQLGLLLSPLPFLAIWAWRPRIDSRSVQMLGLSIILIAGLLCRSDALFLSWGVSGFLLAGVYWLKSITRRGGTQTSAFLAVVLVPCFVLIAIILATTGLIEQVLQGLVDAYENRGQGSLRLQIWGHGFDAFSESPLIGHGPGAFAGIVGPFDGFEAHNTFVDIATKTGVVGLSLYVSLLAAILIRLLRAGEYVVLCALVSITVFSIFHYVLRQPVYWAIVVVSLRVAYGQFAISSLSHLAGNRGL